MKRFAPSCCAEVDGVGDGDGVGLGVEAVEELVGGGEGEGEGDCFGGLEVAVLHRSVKQQMGSSAVMMA